MPRCPSLWDAAPQGDPEYLSLGPIPMGWTSAVGIREHTRRRLNLSLSNTVGLPRDKELRKDRPAPTYHDHDGHRILPVIPRWLGCGRGLALVTVFRPHASGHGAAGEAMIVEG